MYKHILFIFIILIMNIPLRAQGKVYQDSRNNSRGYQENPNVPRDNQGSGYSPRGYQEQGYNTCSYQGNNHNPRGNQGSGYSPGYQEQVYNTCSYQGNNYNPRGYQERGYYPWSYQENTYNPGGYQECSYNSCGYQESNYDVCDQDCGPICCYEICGMSDSYLIPFYGYSVGKTVGIDENFHQFGGTLYFSQFDTVYIFEADALVFDHHKWAASFGGGFRFSGGCECPIFGVNAFYDFREGCFDRFHQFSLGFEFLNFCCLDFRTNFYFPVFGRKKSDTSVFTYPGDYAATCFVRESAPCAVNFEVGMPIYLNCGAWNLYPAIGPYYLSFCDKSAVGVRFRGVLDIRRWLSGELIITYDPIFHSRYEGKFILSIPFNFLRCPCHPKSRCCFPRKLEPIDRFDAIILDKECCWTWNW